MSSNDENKSLTSTNKWKYVPGKIFTLTPLNLEDIKKQLLDTSYEESEDSENDDENFEAGGNTTEILNTSFNAGSTNTDHCPGDLEGNNSTNTEYSNCLDHTKTLTRELTSFSTSLETVPENPPEGDYISISKDTTLTSDNKENISSNMQPLNLSREKNRNDSFDLDFSALSLSTPVKVEKNFNYATPKINIIPLPTKSTIKTAHLFKTPNVENRQNILSKPLFRTPIFSAKKHPETPYSTVKKLAPIQYNVAVEVMENQQSKPVIYSSKDGFNRIRVNSIEYIVMSMLGKGGSSEVFYGFNSEEKLHVAIKLVSLSDPTTTEGYINEVKLLESLQTCDRIIKMYDYEIRDEKLIVLLEKGGEDLSTILKQLATKQSHLSTYMLLFYWMEMLYAVKQIHENGVIHSDLKPSNFLRAEGGLKLIDFGIASKVQGDMTCVYKSNQEGSCNYISPEALSMHVNGNANSPNFGKPKYKVHFKSDVWSLGCILYQLVYRKTPFQHINQIWAKLAAITDQNHTILYPETDWVSPKIVNTIKRCLQYDTKSRPSVEELIDEYEKILNGL